MTDAAERRRSGNDKVQETPASRKSLLLTMLGHLVDGVAQRLAGDRAPVGAAAADLGESLHGRDALAVLHGLHRGPLAAGAAADDHDVEGLSVHDVPFDECGATRNP